MTSIRRTCRTTSTTICLSRSLRQQFLHTGYFVILCILARRQMLPERPMSTRLQSILDAFHDLLFLFTEEGIIKEYLTPSHQEKLILPVEDFVGRHYRDVLPLHVTEKFDRAIEQVKTKGDNCKFDYGIELDGEKQWYEAVISSVDYGDETGYMGAVRDITERKNKENLLEGVLNTAPGGIMVFKAIRDTDDTVVDFEISHVNQAVEKLTALKKEKFIGWKMTDMVPPGPRKTMMKQFHQAMQSGEPVEFDYHHEEPGVSVWYHCKATKFRDGVVSSFLEITEQKEIQRELAQTNEKLKELNRQKDKLFSVIAHDLKNTVSGSTGAFDLLLEDYESFSDEEILEYLTLLRENNRSATNLLEDLLLWSRNQFQEVQTEPEELMLKDITNQVFENTAAKAEEKNIALRNQMPDRISVYADANILKTILRNLVSNGIKFSSEGDEVWVEATEIDQKVNVSVRDTGIGMDEETRSKIMDKKTSYTSSGTKGETGSGLGLDLCIDFAEKLGGELKVESEPGEGSTFTFSLLSKPESVDF